MVYYVMTESELAKFYAIYHKCAEYRGKVIDEIINELGYDPFKQGLKYSSIHARYVAKTKFEELFYPLIEYTKTLIQPIGKNKKDIITSSCMIADKKIDADFYYVINITCAEYMYYERSQCWNIFKENGDWYFKMNYASKTKHKVELP